MADRASLENLIEGLAGAVVEAQNRIEQRQIEIFESFFNKHGRPEKYDIWVPSLRPDRKDKDVRYRVPLLPLVASSLLRIKDVEISFDTDILGIADDDIEGQPKSGPSGSDEKTPDSKKARSINLNIRGAGVFRKKAGTAHVVIKVEGRDISEGMARVVDRLLQVQGEVGDYEDKKEGNEGDKSPQTPQNEGE
jgi:hypothetical protein